MNALFSRISSRILSGALAGAMLAGCIANDDGPIAEKGSALDGYVPLTAPLNELDPDAQLDPALLAYSPVPPPAISGNPSAQNAAREVSFNMATREATIGHHGNKGGGNDHEREGALGAAANLDTFSEQDPHTSLVIGADDRVLITPTTSYPWRANVKLFIRQPNNTNWVCSGALIAAKYVLTAGHCVFMATQGGWASSIQVVPGLDGTYRPYGSAWATFMRSYTGWTQSADSNHDFALITLDRAIGNTTGWFGVGWWSSLTGTTGNLGQYPGDLSGGLRQYYDTDPISLTTSNRAFYNIDTAGGSSGGGVYRIDSGVRRVMVVHTNGGITNSGTRIDQTKFNSLNAWIATGT
jgi:glutamyl endopeptidase